MSNVNHLLTPSHKFTNTGNIIYRVTPVNDDCWQEICDRMDWHTWIDFCIAYPQFNMGKKEAKRDQLLELGIGCRLSKTLFENLGIAKNVIIEDGDTKGHGIRNEIYDQLTTVETLTILEVRSPIYYIESKKIRNLTIKYPRGIINLDPMVQDYANALLIKSTKIEFYSQEGQGLVEESINALFNNPIETLSLENVQLTNYPNFLTKLSMNESLKTIKIKGEFSKDTLQHLLTGPRICREKIKKFEMEICPIRWDFYENIAQFTSLQSIKMYYGPREFPLLTIILYALLNIETLRKIEFIAISSPYRALHDTSNDKEIMDDYRKFYTKRGIDFIEKPIQKDDDDLFFDSIMEVDNE